MTGKIDSPARGESGFADSSSQTYEYENSAILKTDSVPSFFSVVKELWDCRWTIILSTIIATMLSLAFYLFFPLEKKGTLELRPITSFEINQYNEMNAVGGDLFRISRGKLIGILTEDLQTRRSLINAIRKNKIFDPTDFESEEEYENKIVAEAYSVALLPAVSISELDKPGNKGASIFFNIEFENSDEEKLRSVIVDALDESTKNISKNLNKQFNQIIAFEKSKKLRQIEDITRNISLRVDEYNRETTNRKAMLTEQSEIARVLGISKNTLASRTLDADANIVAISGDSGPLFMRGFDALDKEVALLDERKNNLKFVPGIEELQTSINSIKQNPTIDRLLNAYKKTPIAGDNFMASNYQKFGIEVKTPILQMVIPLGIIFLGGFLAIAFVILRMFLSIHH